MPTLSRLPLLTAGALLVAGPALAQSELKAVERFNSLTQGTRTTPTPEPASIGQPPAGSQFAGVGVTSGSAAYHSLDLSPGGTNPFFFDSVASAWKVDGSETTAKGLLQSKPLIVQADGPVTLSLVHDYDFENSWDGGRVAVSVDGGAYTVVPFAGQGAIESNSITNVWTGTASGVNSNAVLFSGTAGQTYRFQLEGLWDNSQANASPNWTINSISVDNTTIGSQNLIDASLVPKAEYPDGQGVVTKPEGVRKLQLARIGNSFATGVPRYFLGDEITPPLTRADGTPLAPGENYWRRAPLRPGESFSNPDGSNLVDTAGNNLLAPAGSSGAPIPPLAPETYESFYYSLHADRVFASQAGTVEIYWVSAAVEGPGLGAWQFRKETFNVSSATSGEVRKIYWTEKSFNAPPVEIPPGRIQNVKPVYSNTFPPSVPEGQEYRPIGTVPEPAPELNPGRQLKTLFADDGGPSIKLRAYNKTGRILVEYLGVELEGGRYEFLGMDVVEVARTLKAVNLTTVLGQQVLPEDVLPGETETDLLAKPVTIQGGTPFYGTRPLPNGRLVYHAERENLNPDKVIFYWQEDRDAGIYFGESPGLSILWPKFQNRYQFVWPDTLDGFAHITTGPDGSTSTNGIQFGEGTSPLVIFQDDPAEEEAVFDVTSQRFTVDFTESGDGLNRALLKFVSGTEVWYVPLYVQADDRGATGGDPYEESDGGPALNAPATVGRRIERPSEEYALAGYLPSGTQYGDGYHPGAYFDPFVIGVEAAESGAIIPVNAVPGNDQLTVRWFTKVEPPSPAFQPFYVPSKVGRYTVSYPSEIGLWTETGALGAARGYHTASLLRDGRVLVVGGFSISGGVLAAAEIYDPATGTWTPTNPMSRGRIYHSATVLRDGKVLVVNDFTSEVFDPSTMSWTVTGGLAAQRVFHTATLLPDGQVLVVGGGNNGGGLHETRVELFNPATTTWTLKSPMTTARDRHTATLLESGKVLVAGGRNVGGPVSTAELYNPIDDSWSPAASSGTARDFPTATRLNNGNVLLVGGGNGAGVRFNTAELYDPEADSWSPTAQPLAESRQFHQATLLPNGEVMVTAGELTNSVEIYSPSANEWRMADSLQTARMQHGATLLADGRVLVSGGLIGATYTDSSELLASASRIVMASNQGAIGLTTEQAAGTIYQQNDPNQPGGNPNEEHARKFGNKFFALRNDLNVTSGENYTSEPYVLISYTDPSDGRPAMRTFRVVREDSRHKFSYPWTAGTKIQGPMPLPLMTIPNRDGKVANEEAQGFGVPGTMPHGEAPAEDSPERPNYARFTFEDRQGFKWVYRGPHNPDTSPAPTFGMKWYYPMQPEFHLPGLNPQPAVGTALPYLRPLIDGVPDGNPVDGEALIVSYTPVWPANPPKLRVAETLTLPKFGLPDVRNQKSAEVFYQQSIAEMGTSKNSVTLSDPTVKKTSEALAEIPPEIRTTSRQGRTFFQGLAPHLQQRFYFDPLAGTNGSLVLEGTFHDVISGEDYLDLNVLSTEDETSLKALSTETSWSDAIDALQVQLNTFVESDAQAGTFEIDSSLDPTPIGENEPAVPRFSDTARDSYALTATGQGTGYVTLLFGNGKNPDLTPQGDPPVVQIIQVEPKLYPGDLKVQLSSNPLDEKVTLRHSADFAAKPGDYEFQWRFAPLGLDGNPPVTYQYDPPASLLGALWRHRRNPSQALPTDFSVGSLELPEGIVIEDSEYNSASGLPGMVLQSNDGLDFTGGIPAKLVFSAKLGDFDGFVLYVNDVPALAHNAPAGFTNTGASSGLSENGLSKQFSLAESFFSNGPNTVVVALYTDADPDVVSNIDFKLEGSSKVDKVVEAGTPWQDPGGTLGHRITTGGDPTGPLGSPILVMRDNFFTMRYRPKINIGNVLAPGADQSVVPWSDWTAPGLVEGWIKRVLAAINPFNQRMSDLFNNAVNTDVSLLTQAGTRWEGDVALTLDAVNDAGLIAIYETVLRRGKGISIDAGYDEPGVNDALLLAAGYLHDLYTILGNEAFADAANPTISIDDQDTITEINTSRFSFEGQVASVLEEELALLRGRDDFLSPAVTQAPFYNRLFWNYTRGIDSGEALYATNYNIVEKAGSSTADGKIDAADAQRMFPQAHGDAYGHYLTAIKGYYQLLTNSNFTWIPRSEALNVLGQTVSVDYQDERKFAEAAANLIRTAEQVVTLTHRQQYRDDPAEGWAHFRDGKSNNQTLTTRDWGLDEWISRSTQGAYYHWVVGNAILPDVDSINTGIQKVDRTTVPELQLLTSGARSLQDTLDNANSHLNPLGLSPGAIAFDISPAELAAGVSHYEQIYDRALGTVLNAKGAFDQAARMTRLLRNQENQIDEFNTAIEDEERAFRYRMIDIYGTPYPGDMGPGKTYVQGYDGPDTVNAFVIDRTPGFVTDPATVVEVQARVPINQREFSGLDSAFVEALEEVDRVATILEQLEMIGVITSNQRLGVRLRLSANEGVEKIKNALGLGPEVQTALPREQLVPLLALLGIVEANPDEFRTVSIQVSPNAFVQFSDLRGTNLGRRAVTGRLQQALLDAELALVALRETASTVQGNEASFRRRTRLITELIAKHAAEVDLILETNRERRKLKAISIALQTAAAAGKAAGESARDAALAASIAPPTSAGTSVDATSPARAGILGAGQTAKRVAQAAGLVSSASAKAVNALRDRELRDLNLALRESNASFEELQMLYEYSVQYTEMINDHYQLQQRAMELQRAAEHVRNVIAQGERLQVDREIFRKRAATIVQGFRTNDLTFRTFRNEALEQYRTLFDLASRYTYLTAKSYDYETGLLGTEEGQQAIAGIVSSRALGDLTNGQPQATISTLGDAGLAGTMAQLQADWAVVEGRLGINNPDQNGTLFSVRQELFRIMDEPDPLKTEDDTAWRQTLEQHMVSDLMSDSDIATSCLNLRKADGSAVPGIVIPFSSTIEQGKNFFGLPLAGGDHTFSPSNFATKIFSVGIVLEGYVGMDPFAIDIPQAGEPDPSSPNSLSATPYVYLIPTGVDKMLAPPLGDTGVERSFTVHDQALPLPFNLGANAFSTTQFFDANGTLSEQPWILRKHPAFRPVDDPAFFFSRIPHEFTNSRLIGRSVWNTGWKIVIPAYSLLENEEQALTRFAASVKDIKLFLRTYSHAGN